MPTKYTNYPIYKYNEPAIYDNFTGGINTDPSNEHLTDTEMRDCVNMTYLSGALVKRKGAKEIAHFVCEDELSTIQGVFLFTYKVTWLVVAADGKLYYGVFQENTEIVLKRLYIYNRTFIKSRVFDETNPFAGINEVEKVLIEKKFDGYIESFYTDILTGEIIYKNFRGIWDDIINTFDANTYENNQILEPINIGDTFEKEGSLKLCVKNFNYSFVNFNNNNFWSDNISEWEPLHTYFENDIVYIIDNQDPTNQKIKVYKSPTENSSVENFNENSWNKLYDGEFVPWNAQEYRTYRINQVVSYTASDHTYYKICLQEHTNCRNIIYQDDYFIDLAVGSTKNLVETQSLIFQNYRSVEAATFNNKLYIATGTRIVEVYQSSGELIARPVEPYMCNMTEISKIGYNYMSPYPELALTSQTNTITTSITSLKVVKNIGGTFTLIPIMNIQSGDSIDNYKFKWEKYIDGTWYTIIPFTNGTYTIDQDNISFIMHVKEGSNSTITVTDADKYTYRCTFAKDFVNAGENIAISDWSIENSYSPGEYISYNGKIYSCIISTTPENTIYPTQTFSIKAFINEEFVDIWEEVYEIQAIPYTVTRLITKNTNDESIFEWIPSHHYNTGDYIIYIDYDNSKHVYRCLSDHTSSLIFEDDYNEINSLWKEIKTTPYVYNIENNISSYAFEINSFSYIYDYIINETGDYFGSATSVLFNSDLAINDTFLTIHSCTKVFVDGDKLLFYDDAYNSGQWFKTIIKNPGYITDRGCLSFKTTKNEALIRIVAFQGNIIAFANSDNVGGSIHLISGNGDDYDDGEGYYSPYQRSTINSSITCDNANTVQVCDNLLVFKYFNRIYYINASDLSNEVVKVTSCNDRIMSVSPDVEIPWNDNDCISEVTDSYYGLLWKEKYELNTSTGDLILVRPAYRVKMYYKMAYELDDHTQAMPWLRDESKVFNIDKIIYLKGKPIYLYNSLFISTDEDTYEDLGNIVDTKIHFRAYDTNYPKLVKMLNNVLVYYHRDQFSLIDFKISAKNESGYTILDNTSNLFSTQDLRVLKEGDKINKGEFRTGQTILDSKVFNPKRSFPYLLIDTTITNKNKGAFSVSSITYNYTATDAPDTTMYSLYSDIIRPDEIS